MQDEELLIKTFAIHPEYLKTAQDEHVNNYRDWGIQLGRRFRALKLWFVIRHFGVEGLREKIRLHLNVAQHFTQKVKESSDFELLAPVPFNTICLRYHPSSIKNEQKLDELNEKLLNRIQQAGDFFLTHTRLNEKFTIRVVLGNTNLKQRHADELWGHLRDVSQTLIN